jgi:uncharacterized protein YjbI with pentapeptide repeats
MASREHVKIFEQGPDAWNRWRIDNPWVVPDLSGIDFSGADLCVVRSLPEPPREAGTLFAELKPGYRVLARAMEDRVDLNGINFYRTNLTKASLRRTRMRKATLDSSDLSGADLSGAILVEARCRSTTFRNQAGRCQSDWGRLW